MTGATSTSVSVARPATGAWLAYQLTVCRADAPATCLAGLPICKPVAANGDTQCTISGATPGRSYTVRAVACPDEDCQGIKSKMSLLADAPQFSTPYP